MMKQDKALTVRVSTEQIDKIDALIKRGEFDKRSQVVRKALKTFLATVQEPSQA